MRRFLPLVLLVVLTVWLRGGNAVAKKEQHFYQYVDSSGETVLVNDIDLVPENRRHTLRGFDYQAQTPSRPAKVEDKKATKAAQKTDAQQTDAMAGCGEKSQEFGWSSWLNRYKYYLATIIVLAIALLIPGLRRFRGPLGLLASVVLSSLVLSDYLKSKNTANPCGPDNTIMGLPNPEKVKRDVDRAIKERSSRQDKILEAK